MPQRARAARMFPSPAAHARKACWARNREPDADTPGALDIFTEKGEYLRMDLDHTLIALADPTRRAILQRLSRGEARVTEIALPFAMSLNAVSKHIRVLEGARLVRRRRAG